MLSRTGWEGSWPRQAKGRTSTGPPPNDETILSEVLGFCLQKKRQTAGLSQGRVIPRNRMHRPGPYLVTPTSLSYHASPEQTLRGFLLIPFLKSSLQRSALQPPPRQVSHHLQTREMQKALTLVQECGTKLGSAWHATFAKYLATTKQANPECFQ